METILAVLALLLARTDEDMRTLQKSEWFRRAKLGGTSGAELADAAVRFFELAEAGKFSDLRDGNAADMLARALGVPAELLTLLRGADLGALFRPAAHAEEKNPFAPIAFADAEIVAALNRYFS